jgi:hypothetical protein
MIRKTLTTVSAAALSLSLIAGAPALAQQQLGNQIADRLVAMGFNVDEIGMVSEEQALEIENVLNTSDDDQTKKTRIEEILAE